MIKLNCFVIAEYAGTTADGRLTIAGTFDNVDVTRFPGAPPDALSAVPFPRAYLVAISEASIADGLTHQITLRIVNGNGDSITDPTVIAVNYILNAFGRPMRNNLVISLNGLILPGPDDYVFELWAEGQSGRLGDFTFSVTDVTGRPDV